MTGLAEMESGTFCPGGGDKMPALAGERKRVPPAAKRLRAIDCALPAWLIYQGGNTDGQVAL